VYYKEDIPMQIIKKEYLYLIYIEIRIVF
jgi:hypothetical protein